MSYDLVVKFARAYDPGALLGPVRGSGTMYEPAGLTFRPSQQHVPVVVDHDIERQLGVAVELGTLPWTDTKWLIARCKLDAPAPSWIKQWTTKASFSYRPLRSYEINGWTIVARALLDEITIVREHEAVEPCAEVLLYRASKESKPAPALPHVDAPGVLYRPNIGYVTAIR